MTQNHPRRIPHRLVSSRAIFALAPVLALTACIGPFDTSDYLEYKPDAERLYEIDAIRLEESSRSEPITVEEATKEDLGQRLTEPSEPPETLDVTLEEVRAAALENNLDLQVALIDPTIAQTSVDEEEARFEAVFNASYTRSKTDSPTPTPFIEGSQVQRNNYDLGVSIPLRTGGTARVDLPFSDTDTNNPSAVLNPSYETALSFSISQPLLRGAGNRVNTHSIRVAKHQRQISDALTKLETIRILANADRAYWNLYAARKELDVRQQQYELAMRQLERARHRVAAGDVAEIEVIRAQSGVAQRLEGIIIAETTVRRAERDLKRIMNRDDLPMRSPTRIVPMTEPDPLGLDLDPDALAEYAVENRMEMLELEVQLAIDASTIDFQRNAKLPLFTLDYTYSLNGLGPTYADGFDQIVDRSFDNWVLRVGAEIPIGNEAAEARFHRAVLQRVQRLATRSQRDLSIRQEVLDAIDQLEQSWQRILAARQDVLLAGRTFEAEQRQFEVGARTSTDVLDAATRLADAQSSEIRALTDYQIAQVDLAFATGTLLGYEKVRWEPIDPTVEDEYSQDG